MCVDERGAVQRLPLPKCHKWHEKVRCSAFRTCQQRSPRMRRWVSVPCVCVYVYVCVCVCAVCVCVCVGFPTPDTVLQPEDTQHTHLAVPVPSLHQEPPGPAAFVCKMFWGLLLSWVHLGPTSSAALRAAKPSCPLSHPAIFTQELCYSAFWRVGDHTL